MKANARHWTLQRLTSIPLALLFVYFIGQAQFVTTKSREVFISWVKEPQTSGALVLFIIFGFWHASFGIEEIITDYVPSAGKQKFFIFLSKLFFFVLGLACLYAVLTIKSRKY